MQANTQQPVTTAPVLMTLDLGEVKRRFSLLKTGSKR